MRECGSGRRPQPGSGVGKKWGLPKMGQGKNGGGQKLRPAQLRRGVFAAPTLGQLPPFPQGQSVTILPARTKQPYAHPHAPIETNPARLPLLSRYLWGRGSTSRPVPADYRHAPTNRAIVHVGRCAGAHTFTPAQWSKGDCAGAGVGTWAQGEAPTRARMHIQERKRERARVYSIQHTAYSTEGRHKQVWEGWRAWWVWGATARGDA
jgi:hypothetical protein